MIVWDMANSIGRLALMIVVVVKITHFSATLNRIERFGMGMMGAGSFLTINVIWERQASPYDGWASTMLTWGAILFLSGRTYRDWCHELNNNRQVHSMRAELRARGKEI